MRERERSCSHTFLLIFCTYVMLQAGCCLSWHLPYVLTGISNRNWAVNCSSPTNAMALKYYLLIRNRLAPLLFLINKLFKAMAHGAARRGVIDRPRKTTQTYRTYAWKIQFQDSILPADSHRHLFCAVLWHPSPTARPMTITRTKEHGMVIIDNNNNNGERRHLVDTTTTAAA